MPGVDFTKKNLQNFYSQNSTPFLANSVWQIRHRFGEFWPIISAINFVGEIEHRIFWQTPSFCLAKKFGEIDLWGQWGKWGYEWQKWGKIGIQYKGLKWRENEEKGANKKIIKSDEAFICFALERNKMYMPTRNLLLHSVNK